MSGSRRAARAPRAPRVPRTGRAPRPPRRPWATALAAAAAVLVGVPTVVALVVAGFAAHLVSTFDDRATTIDRAFPSELGRPPVDESGALTVLLLGTDSAGTSPTDAAPGVATPASRTDTVMLVRVPADRSEVVVLSVLRDSWVDVPGHGSAKINAAHAWGGVPLVVETVEALLGVRVDHVATVGFEGFAGMSEALGGVDVVSERSFSAGGHDFDAGVNHLAGDRALDFVRARAPFADADHQRARNQQAFVRGLVSGLLDRGTLSDPVAVSGFVGVATEHLAVDPGLTPRRLVEIGWGLRDLSPSGIRTATVPTAGGGVSDDGQSYVSLDPDGVRSLGDALRADEVGAWLDGRAVSAP
ncbi:LCP family protein [Frigoribacterium sp. CFBP 13707]|uniref:LCP family protein n=1 Tax=Frigoribacterium sp. CFBP 13707 TaxID=2775313 RepID=UPI00177ADCDE|nr:LCP family protein [Frigoribacterium sp. CFBP 13707]